VRQTTKRNLTAAVVADRYRLEREMARGGMGTVWLARDNKLGRAVAIKVMAQELAQMGEALQRFEREAQSLAALRSSHVVEVYDYGVQEGLPYIVMELLEGENLGQRLKRVGRFDAAQVGVLFAQICKGLKAAHNAKLIHRDLKPSNIFIARRDDTEVVKLLDFGVVKLLDPQDQSEQTVTGLLLGTPQYMSPEQARATRDIDHRSDLWSAAVIAFRLLTGHNPFKGESVGDVVLKICSDALPRITDYRHDLPETLDEFFEKSFQRLPDDRYQSATEMSVEFARLLSMPMPFGAVNSGSGSNYSRASFENLGESLEDFVPAHLRPEPLPPPASMPAMPAPTPLPNIGVVNTDATPHSTTVGGTQLASKKPPAMPRQLSGQPLALVVGAAATLITVALVAAIWIGSGPSETATASETRAVRSDVDLTSNDDDGDPNVEQLAEEEERQAKLAREAEEQDANDQGDGDQDDAGASEDIDDLDDPKATKRSTSKGGSESKSKPKGKSGNDRRPDWGLGQ
jgi:serine/threonine protein kinase